MKLRKTRRRRIPSLMMAELAMDSAETIWRRLSMMAQGRCSPAEYTRMASEKAEAAIASTLALAGSGKNPMAAMLAPWHRRARANAKRLRKRR